MPDISTGFERRADEAAHALRIMEGTMAMEASRIQLLQTRVFALFNESEVRTRIGMIINPSKTLESFEAHKILAVIWKWDRKISDLGISSIFKPSPNKPINQYALARALCSGVDDLGTMNTFVRNVCVSGEAYGLLNRTQINQKLVHVTGTDSLHSFMLAVACENRRIMEALQPFFSTHIT